jgi:signal transduction histidine kinase
MNTREESITSELANARPRRQAVVAELGRQALLGVSGEALMSQAVTLVAEALAADGSRILRPGQREGEPAEVIGWLAGEVQAIVFDQDERGWLGYTLHSAEPVIVADMDLERRFILPAWWQAQKVGSVISVALPGPAAPVGVLAAYSQQRDGFSADDTLFLQSVALVIAAALEREGHDEELRRSKGQLEAILQGVTEGITVQAAGGLLYANEAAAGVIGFDSVEELLSTPLAQIMERFEVMDEAGRPFPLRDLPGRQALLGKQPEEVLLRFRNKASGEEQWSLVNARPVLGEDGQVEFVVNIFRNISERVHRYEAERAVRAEALAEANRRLEAEIQMADTLATISLALSKTLDADTILRTLLDEVGRLVPYDSAAVMVLDEEGKLVVRALRGHEQWSTDVALAQQTSLPVDSTPNLRTVLREQRSLLIEDTHDYPGWLRLPGTAYIRNWLGVPLLIGEQAVGVLTLDKAEPAFFTEGQQRLVEVLVTQVAIALQNSRLFDDVRRSREQLRQLSRQVLTALEDERRHVSRELHDEAGQVLTALKIGLALLRSDLPAGPAQGQLQEFEGQVGETLERIRRLAQTLRPPALETTGLAFTLRSFCEDFTARTQLPVMCEGEEMPGVPEEILLSLYRFVQEGLTNVLKHAQASLVQVAWRYDGQVITVSVTDDGRGFRLESLPAVTSSLRGIGLLGMQERLELLGGRVWVESEPGKGTCLTAFVPWVKESGLVS